MAGKQGGPEEGFDIVVVGAGPAGCAVAARLAEARPNWSIALIETGPAKPGIFSHIPLGLAVLVPRKSRYNYAYETVPQAGLGGRRGYQPRGRGVGGSSLINAMIYIRGQREDYDDWAADGCTGWGADDVLPYFRRSEDNSRGADAWHGSGGPLAVSDLCEFNGVTDAFLKAAAEAGHGTNADFNAATQGGVGRYQVFQRAGHRIDAGSAYLAHSRPNLTVIADTQAEKLVIEDGEARGVLVVHRGKRRTIRARREVVVSGGAFGSPQLLMLSGIGPAAHLREHGIAVVADRAGVGADLQDHLDHISSLKLKAPGAFGMTLPLIARAILAHGAWRGGRGMLTTNIAEAGGFLRADPLATRPDIQLHFCVGIVDDHSRKMHFTSGVSLHACVLRPKSRGTVRLASANPADAPAIDPNFLSAPEDLALLTRGVKIVQDILAAPAMARLAGRPVYPLATDDAAIERAIRATSDTIYHPVGTCRMGADAASVVDPALRVRGIGRLRVADASIMPRLVSGNTEAPTAMIGEKAADLILQDVA